VNVPVTEPVKVLFFGSTGTVKAGPVAGVTETGEAAAAAGTAPPPPGTGPPKVAPYR
jgi:hypothetical protein